MEPLVLLASQSPRRRELLDRIGVGYEVLPVDIDETPAAGEGAERLVLRLALEKARRGQELGGGRLPALGADTAVVLDGKILGKPADRADGLALLERLSGRTHRVVTGVAVSGEREATRLSVSQVTLRSTTSAERERYWASGEPADKAGAYAIQGRGGVLVERLEGDYTGVMGLPLLETTQLLDELDIPWREHW